ncbi:MAG: hydrogen gas-evolving membrane-bound hydrogenase subunit E [Planctomycetota bacterium]|nr:hydrogen gas-evolving membrane-bound hydrogenase subunit E [Planctomycetota bacterium]
MLLLAVLLGFVIAPLCPALCRVLGSRSAWLVALAPAVIFAWLLSRTGAVVSGGEVRFGMDWMPTLGASLSLRLDALSLLFALLISGIGTLIVVYARGYFQDDLRLGRLLGCLMFFMGSMLGVVLADNVLALFLFWELTGVASYLLIGFHHDALKARKAALQALLVTGLGGLALLIGLVLLGKAAGTFELSAMARNLPAGGALLPAAIPLILIGCFAKSAQFPLHFWLPSAMEAPTPVSAYLHSSTMVKAGVYLLARLAPTLSSDPTWTWALLVFGGLTVLAGTCLTLAQRDFKKLLAYSTVTSLGTMVLLIGLGTPQSAKAALALVLAHGLYKGAMFMVAGIIIHSTHRKNADEIRGLGSIMRGLWFIALLAGASMMGLPPLMGFLSKELSLEAVLYGAQGSPHALKSVLTLALVAGSAAAMIVACRVAIEPFVRGSGAAIDDDDHPPHSPGWTLLAGPAVLAVLGVMMAVWPGSGSGPLIASAASVLHGSPVDSKLALWHGFTPALGLSVLAIAAGAVLFAARRRVVIASERTLTFLAPIGPAAWYDRCMTALTFGSAALTRWVQSDRLRIYSAWTIGTAIAIVFTLALLGNGPAGGSAWRAPLAANQDRGAPLPESTLALLSIVGALLTVRAAGRLRAVIGLGMVSLGITGLFAVMGGPDLAMTQIAVDALTIVLLLVAFASIPELRRISGGATRARDGAIALAAGLAMAWLTLAASNVQLAEPISAYHSASAVEQGKGRNVVNVILVDFRALDTLGEISVVATAAIGLFVLIRRKRPGVST